MNERQNIAYVRRDAGCHETRCSDRGTMFRAPACQRRACPYATMQYLRRGQPMQTRRAV